MEERGKGAQSYGTFCIYLILCLYQARLTKEEAIMLSNALNMSTEMVWGYTFFAVIIKAGLSFSWALGLQYGAGSVHKRNQRGRRNLDVNMIPTYSHPCYAVQCNVICRVMNDKLEVHPLSEMLDKEHRPSEELFIFHLNCIVLYTSNSQDNLLKLDAADYFVKNNSNRGPFNFLTFYNADTNLLTDHDDIYH